MYAGMYILQYCCVLGYAILWLKILICDELRMQLVTLYVVEYECVTCRCDE